MITKPIDISIFMPVFNGRRYLEESIKSVLNQTFKNFELVCVDDSSTDDSFKIIKEIADKDARIRLYQKPNGGTVPKSWNFVLPKLNGRNITYMSQDDLMSEDNLEKMLQRQIETDADCVLPDMVFYSEGKPNNLGRFGVNGNRVLILSNKEAVLLSLKWRIHGFALWKSKLFENEKFPEDSFDSDEYMVRKLFLKSNKIAFCKSTFYYRQDNEQAITKSFGFKNYFSILRDYKINRLLLENNFDAVIVASKVLEMYIFYIKLYRFHLHRKGIYSEIAYKEIHSMLGTLFIKLNKEKLISFAKQKLNAQQLKINSMRVLFYNYTIFKIILFNIYFVDMIKNKVKKIKNVILNPYNQ
ncbi:glycosyltransferase family 2 protein [Lutibacter sp.]|uniref:glycosyltransferase family 2 protein n=1 Tax=Lutibacter sp. TaxID=1925666 RepID=UPI00273571DA|nr:glycosyltransferase family 2 protein [Lutibacter sp.]MDP3312591.1 glycosyltransferase family 2 protein [Lutibacter sp.]